MVVGKARGSLNPVFPAAILSAIRDPMRILFVCLGNICRSPTAEGVLRSLAEREYPSLDLEIDSAGTADYHVGEPPDRRTVAAARRRGYDLAGLRARLVQPDDFRRFDYILAMDKSNLSELTSRRTADATAELALFMSFADGSEYDEVPDPYYGGVEDFERVLDLCETASRCLLRKLQA
jgi:protein-tyrosine phosphatase